ncbi:hypothetical protein [Paenibacillus cucumis (ex Kampfer et al. 2016)]|uniref:Uncharacterized protein n=1 Tax=Paenibacillus cucumis (ex Kampfer et al. 2016) TaxID=1776858 RepID=A0ABS7KDY6_9BACL|nr:hypothetical protein [Paenibacillus cucumis (ex Kampfer et al. 2016)]MBY0202156.1 hypothetical protein [Paenibacillus cucumis (ex Kampfer et al. 2016)]
MPSNILGDIDGVVADASYQEAGHRVLGKPCTSLAAVKSANDQEKPYLGDFSHSYFLTITRDVIWLILLQWELFFRFFDEISSLEIVRIWKASFRGK